MVGSNVYIKILMLFFDEKSTNYLPEEGFFTKRIKLYEEQKGEKTYIKHKVVCEEILSKEEKEEICSIISETMKIKEKITKNESVFEKEKEKAETAIENTLRQIKYDNDPEIKELLTTYSCEENKNKIIETIAISNTIGITDPDFLEKENLRFYFNLKETDKKIIQKVFEKNPLLNLRKRGEKILKFLSIEQPQIGRTVK